MQSCTTNRSDSPYRDTVFIGKRDTIYVVQPASIFGLWVGTYNIVEGPDAGEEGFHYSFDLHTDHVIQMTSIGADGLTGYAVGNWNLQNDTAFSAHITTVNLAYRGTPQTVTATYDSLHRRLSGTVTNDINQFKATFSLEKVP